LQARIVLLVDLDYFYAQCEEMRQPNIKDKPVVVCVYSGRTEDSGAVSTANYVARKFGVKSGIPISLAKKKLKNTDAVFLPVDLPFYKKISNSIMKILNDQADRFEQVGIDEAYLDVTNKTKIDYLEARKLGLEIKRKILFSQKLTCSIGIGPNKLIAKIAAGMQKPDGLTIVKAHNIASFLSPLPVRRLIGVGKKTEKKLEVLDVRTIGQLSKVDIQQLIEIFGKKIGTYFRDASSGIDNEPVQERSEPESLSKISTLKENTKKLSIILNNAFDLCKQVHTKLIEYRLLYRSISIYIVAGDLRTFNRSKTLEDSTENLDLFINTVRELFEKFLEESDIEVRRIGVKVSNLTKKETGQKQLINFF
jgi:DNA polymerase IV (DinB-like DNA polymerase)